MLIVMYTINSLLFAIITRFPALGFFVSIFSCW